MANVTKGAKTAGGAAKPKPAGNNGPANKPADDLLESVSTEEAAARLRETLDAELSADAGAIAYVGNTGHLYAEVPKPILDHERKVVGRDNGLYIDFRGLGITDKYYPEKSAKDRAYVERMDAWLESGADEIETYNIRKLSPGQPEPPIQGWDNISASALAEIVGTRLGDDHDANVEYVKECARYEREVGSDRSDVLAVLDGLLVTEAAGSDVFEATVVLN